VAGRRIIGRVPPSHRTPALEAWVDSLQRIENARVELDAALSALAPWIVDAVDAVASGEPMSDLVRRTHLRARRRVADAVSAMNSALAENRIAAIRVIVDDEGLTMSEAARLFGIPRQVLSRLYHGGG
jgi:helix-turn-helix, Psq domain